MPRQATTGGKPRLLGVSKRGSKYLRKMLIQGASAAMPTLRKSDTRLGAWLRRLLSRAQANVAVVALAAKMARIVWLDEDFGSRGHVGGHLCKVDEGLGQILRIQVLNDGLG